jgi:hypothetical protein
MENIRSSIVDPRSDTFNPTIFEAVERHLFELLLRDTYPAWFSSYLSTHGGGDVVTGRCMMINIRVVEGLGLQGFDDGNCDSYCTTEVLPVDAEEEEEEEPEIEDQLVDKEKDNMSPPIKTVSLQGRAAAAVNSFGFLNKKEAKEGKKDAKDAKAPEQDKDPVGSNVAQCTRDPVWDYQSTVFAKTIEQSVDISVFHRRLSPQAGLGIKLKDRYMGSVRIRLSEFCQADTAQTDAGEKEGEGSSIGETGGWRLLQNHKKKFYLVSGWLYIQVTVKIVERPYTQEFMKNGSFQKRRKKTLFISPSSTVEETPVKIWTGTWNMGDSHPPSVLIPWLQTDEKYDLYVIGVQECHYEPPMCVGGVPRSESCFSDFLSILFRNLGTSYELVGYKSLMSIRIVVFASARICPYINQVLSDKVPTGVGSIMGNKGGVALYLRIFHTSYCFINCHLAAHQDMTLHRNADVNKILRSLRLGNLSKQDPMSMSDYVFWIGDMNYRVHQVLCASMVCHMNAITNSVAMENNGLLYFHYFMIVVIIFIIFFNRFNFFKLIFSIFFASLERRFFEKSARGRTQGIYFRCVSNLW